MAYPYDNTNNNTNYSASFPPPPSEQDEISLFLQQFLFASPSRNENQQPGMVPYPGRISVPETSSGLNSSPGGWFPANLSSSSVGTLENDPDEYDCESEEAIEGLLEDAAAKPAQQRNSFKRSRAAEVHNLSEKRRRSRINEKMKALQNLIPNSNKMDKASMLDEAIEYLKQLQLQVQMLTMRNGLSLYPVCLPGMIQPNQISQMTLDMFEKNKSVNMSTTKPIHTTNQDVSADNLINLQENRANPVPDFSIRSKSLFDVESSIQNHFLPFQVSRGIHREEVLPSQPLNGECSLTNLLAVAKSKSSVAFDTQQPSKFEDNALEACLLDGNCLSGTPVLPNLLNTPIISSQLKLRNEGRQASDNIKTKSN